jgi:hypothetical protein
MLKKSAGIILPSLKASHTNRVCLGPLLVAALLDGLFEPPVRLLWSVKIFQRLV